MPIQPAVLRETNRRLLRVLATVVFGVAGLAQAVGGLARGIWPLVGLGAMTCLAAAAFWRALDADLPWPTGSSDTDEYRNRFLLLLVGLVLVVLSAYLSSRVEL